MTESTDINSMHFNSFGATVKYYGRASLRSKELENAKQFSFTLPDVSSDIKHIKPFVEQPVVLAGVVEGRNGKGNIES